MAQVDNLINRRELQTARKLILSAISRFPNCDDPQAMLLSANAYLIHDPPEFYKAQDLLEDIRDNNQGTRICLLATSDLAWCYRLRGQFTLAASLYLELAKQYKSTSTISQTPPKELNRNSILNWLRKKGKSSRIGNMDLDRKYIDSVNGLAFCLLRMNRPERSLRVLDDLLQEVPSNQSAHLRRAQALFDLGRLQHAKLELLQLHQEVSDRHSAEKHYLLGCIAYRKESWDEARRQWRKALYLAPLLRTPLSTFLGDRELDNFNDALALDHYENGVVRTDVDAVLSPIATARGLYDSEAEARLALRNLKIKRSAIWESSIAIPGLIFLLINTLAQDVLGNLAHFGLLVCVLVWIGNFVIGFRGNDTTPLRKLRYLIGIIAAFSIMIAADQALFVLILAPYINLICIVASTVIITYVIITMEYSRRVKGYSPSFPIRDIAFAFNRSVVISLFFSFAFMPRYAELTSFEYHRLLSVELWKGFVVYPTLMLASVIPGNLVLAGSSYFGKSLIRFDTSNISSDISLE